MTISSGSKKHGASRKPETVPITNQGTNTDAIVDTVPEAVVGAPGLGAQEKGSAALPSQQTVEHVVDEVEAPKTTHLMDINIAGTGVAFYLEGMILKSVEEAREAYASGSVKLVRRPTKAKTSMHLAGTSRSIAGTDANRIAREAFLNSVRPLTILGHDVRISSGLIAIIGGGGTGKTPLAASVSDQLDAVHLTAMEPYPWSLTDMPNVIGAIGLALIAGMNVVVDSLKDVLFIGSSLGTGGVAMDTFADITALSSISGQMGCVCVCVFNPLYEQDAKIRAIETMMSSSANAVITHYQCDGTVGKDEVSERGWYAIFRDYAASLRVRKHIGSYSSDVSVSGDTTRPVRTIVTSAESVAASDLVAEANRVQVLNRYERN